MESKNKEESREENVEEDTNIFSVQNILKYGLTDFKLLFIGIFLSIVLLVYYLWNQKPLDIKNIFYILLPTLTGIVTFYFYHMPKPRKAYIVSLLYEDKPIKSQFIHKSDKGWPFSGSAVIKINKESYIFVGGGDGQNDALLKYDLSKKKFINYIDKSNLGSKESTYSAISFDLDGNGEEDLIVGREDGVYLYKHNKNFTFDKKRIVGKLNKVPLGITISDYNKDGKPDIYISYFTNKNRYRGTVFNDISHGRKNILLKNTTKDKITFQDVTKETNAGGTQYNTFAGAFIDLNNDTWPDVVLSHDSGEIEILKNLEGKFESSFASPSKGNYMGIASGDIDNDGDQDLFFTNIGSDIRKDAISLGDVKKGQKQAFKHMLLRNDGEFKFIDIDREKGIDGTGFGWGAILADINNDTNLELLFAENTLIYPLHHIYPKPGHYYEMEEGKFHKKFKYRNAHFGQTPLITDINGDLIKDVVWINMNGPVVGYINQNRMNNYIIVELPQINKYLNARIVVDTGKKKIYRENIQGGLGFGSDDSTSHISIGLGDLESIKEIKIYTIDGDEYSVKNPKVNSIIKPVHLRNK